MNNKIGTAKLANKGILFNKKYYFSIYAIRQRWFELAHVYGNWKLSVYYNPLDNSTIYFINEEQVKNKCVN